MALPSRVQEQAAKANTMIAQPGGQEPVVGGQDQAPANGKPVAAVPGADKQRYEVLIENERMARERAEQQYRTLQGKYNAEVPRHVEEKRQLERQLEESATKTRELEAQLAANSTRSATEAPRERLTKLLGEEAAAEVIAIAKAEANAGRSPAAPEKPAAKTEDKPVERREEVRAAEEAPTRELFDRYSALLTRLVPDWATINEDAKFLAWLNIKDRSPTSRYSVLLRNDNALDAVKVADVFLAYKEGRELGQRADPLAHLVSPDAGSGDSTPADDGGKKTWTRAEITQFYKDCKLGKYKGKVEERARIEVDIMTAGKEGRVRE